MTVWIVALLETLQSAFDGNVERFDDTFGLMKSLMIYGSRVAQTPIDEDRDPNVGPNAGPTYTSTKYFTFLHNFSCILYNQPRRTCS